MKMREPPIPLRSVIGIPPWLMWIGTLVSGACMLGGLALIVYGLLTAHGARLGGWIGGGIGALLGGAGGLFGTLRDWHLRMPAPIVFSFLAHDRPSPFYRRVFWPAVLVTALALAIGLAFGHWRWLQGFLQTGAILAIGSGSLEAARRHTAKQARTVFTLYADGLLDPAEAAAIDDARAKDPVFAKALADHQRIADAVRRLANG